VNYLKDISPAFVNRFDVGILENQLDNLSNAQYSELISIIFNSFDRTLQRENIKILKIKEEIIKKENEFMNKEKNMLNKIIDKIKILPENKINNESNISEYSHIRTISALNRFCYGIQKLRKLFGSIKYETDKITDDDIINTVFEILFRDDTEKIEISENIKNALLKELIEENEKKMKGINKDKYEKYFFEKSESLKKFVLFIYISSLINLYLCIASPPGSGKKTAARSIAEIRAKILNQLIPFYIHKHHSSTKPDDFYGITTISDSQVIFKEGSLTLAIKQGSVYIADEFNISSELNMKSMAPVLEQIFNQDLIIPGIDGIVSIDPNFFFIICQNDAGTIGRNELPDKMKIKLRKVVYPEQTKEDIESICVSLNNSFYEKNQKNKLEDIEAKYCGDFMIKVNQNNLDSQTWSLRDISKIFLRMKNQKIYHENYINIGTAINLFFYILSSTTKDQLSEELVDKSIRALEEIFKDKIKKEDLKNILYEEAKLYDEFDQKTKIRKYYIRKHNSLIFFDQINEDSKKDEDKMEKKRKLLEKYNKLPNLLDCLFKIKLSNYDETLLLTGPTCYKTYAAKMILEKADVVPLNEESVIPQLLGSLFFFPPKEDKKFCIKLIYEILGIPNVEIELNKIDEWEKYKDEIFKTIQDKMPDPDSPFYCAFINLKNKIFSEEKLNDKSLKNREIEFKPRLILSAILNKKSLILKDISKVKAVVLERFDEIFSGKHNLILYEDISGTLTTRENKEIRNFNQNSRVIATCKSGEEIKLSEAILSRFTVIACEPYTEEEKKILLKNTGVENLDI